ncbi:unnamed protein product [Heterobilharzia americana]|nr:unnamed protein product [Heterobilharzia americana]
MLGCFLWGFVEKSARRNLTVFQPVLLVIKKNLVTKDFQLPYFHHLSLISTLYFLRLRRFCQFILNLSGDGFYSGWFGKESYCILNTPEDFRLLNSEKARVICAMWHFLSRHKFKEAAKLLAHSIHVYPMSPSWIWRVAFHIFQCLNDDVGLKSFNEVLDIFLLSDENNRMLEYILHEISKGNLEKVQFCRANKQVVQRNKYGSIRTVLTREPEFAHVERLQRLYEGYSFFGMWLKQIHSMVSCDDPEENHVIADDLAEKAYHRLQEVEALVSEGHLCDAFVRSFVEILQYFNECTRAHALLLAYAQKVPENPNTLRYLCEWHKRQPGPVSHSSVILSPSHSIGNNTHNDSSAYLTDDLSGEIVDSDRIVNPDSTHRMKSSKSLKSLKTYLKYRISFCRRVLPEPAPCLPDNYDNMTKKEVRDLLRTNHAHVQTIVTCLKRGKLTDALDLSFSLLDHPSWAVFCEPWRLLRKSILIIGKNNSQVLHAWSVRKMYWNKLHFRLPNLPAVGKSVKTMLNKLDLSNFNLCSENSLSSRPQDIQLNIVSHLKPVTLHNLSSMDMSS